MALYRLLEISHDEIIYTMEICKHYKLDSFCGLVVYQWGCRISLTNKILCRVFILTAVRSMIITIFKFWPPTIFYFMIATMRLNFTTPYLTLLVVYNSLFHIICFGKMLLYVHTHICTHIYFRFVTKFKKYRDIPYTPCPNTCIAFPIITISPSVVYFLQVLNLHWYLIITHAHSLQYNSLAVM